MRVKIKKLNDKAVMPQWNNRSAGCDLFSTDFYTLKPGERKLFKTGLSVAIPDGLYGRIAPRSGLAYKDGIDVMAGVIDEDYRGEIGVILINLGQVDKSIFVGDKIAQLILENYNRADFYWVDELDETTRGAGGYGSTDNKVVKQIPASTPTSSGFVLLGQTTIERIIKDPKEVESVKSYLGNYQGEIYLYEENGKKGLCVVDASGARLIKHPL